MTITLGEVCPPLDHNKNVMEKINEAVNEFEKILHAFGLEETLAEEFHGCKTYQILNCTAEVLEQFFDDTMKQSIEAIVERTFYLADTEKCVSIWSLRKKFDEEITKVCEKFVMSAITKASRLEHLNMIVGDIVKLQTK